MLIDQDLCLACEECAPYCPVGAISANEWGYSEIDLDLCCECSNCLRVDVCPNEAIYQQPLEWPRTIRSILSDVLTVAEESQISGRGTEEMKTNDVTGRYRRGYAGIGIELGRPVLGAHLYDVEKVARAVAELGDIHFEPQNPTTSLMSDTKTGAFKEDVLNEFVLSAIIEFSVPLERVPQVLAKLEKVSGEIETVFSLDIITRVGEQNEWPTEELVKELGYYISSNGKTNIGLGRPAKVEA
jgi:NAD-dependent dihydropyrimidine dehydrogenase PreA subunit